MVPDWMKPDVILESIRLTPKGVLNLSGWVDGVVPRVHRKKIESWLRNELDFHTILFKWKKTEALPLAAVAMSDIARKHWLMGDLDGVN